MAPSSSQLGAARAPPPPDQLAAFYKLVDKHVIASHLYRNARSVELSAQAAAQAEVLFGDDSLVVASLRMVESDSLASLSQAASGAVVEPLVRRSFAALLSLIPLLLRRIEANTLLPGTIREEELDFEAHVQAVLYKAANMPVLPPAVLRAWASVLGYKFLMNAVSKSPDLLHQPFWSAEQKRLVESFVLQGLDVIPRTAGIPAEWITGEDRVVAIIEQEMSPLYYEATFCAAVLRKWRSDAVSSVLRAHGAMQTGIAKLERSREEFRDRQLADIAKHGLRDCALPSCSKTEKTVKEFAVCSGCRSVVYCCLEHQALDWTKHKKACREKEAARLAEEEAEQEAEEGAGGGAWAA